MSTKQTAVPPTPPGKVPFDFHLWYRGIRNADLAKSTGISDTEISRFRKGLRPSAENASKLVKALNVSEAELGWESETVDA